LSRQRAKRRGGGVKKCGQRRHVVVETRRKRNTCSSTEVGGGKLALGGGGTRGMPGGLLRIQNPVGGRRGGVRGDPRRKKKLDVPKTGGGRKNRG